MRTTRIVRDLTLLFIGVLLIVTVFAVAGRVRAAYGAEEAVVTRATYRMAVQGQVRRHKRDARTIRRLRRELHTKSTLVRRLGVRLRTARAEPHGSHPIERAFLCIYGGENGGHGWGVNTGNGYYGGLQMDRQFQATYGPEFLQAWGTANNWPVSVQLAVGMRAYLSGRGFNPWPNTSRACGLR